MFRAGIKWHEEGEKNNAYFLGLMNSKYSRLELNKVTDDTGTTIDHNTIILPVVFFRSLAMKHSRILRVLGLGAFFRLVTYLLPMVGS